MSILIDKFLKEASTSTTEQAKDLHFYIAKPIPFCSLKTKLRRIKDAIRVLRGKSFAVHYKIDE